MVTRGEYGRHGISLIPHSSFHVGEVSRKKEEKVEKGPFSVVKKIILYNRHFFMKYKYEKNRAC